MSDFKSANQELEHLKQLLEQEKQAELEAFAHNLETQSTAQRSRNGISWYPVSISDSGYGLGDYPFLIVERPASQTYPHHLHGGRTVRLFSEEAEAHLQGVVHFVSGNRMKIIFYADDLPDWLDHGTLGVDLLPDAHSYREMEKALDAVQTAERDRLAELREILLGYKAAVFNDPMPSKADFLNASQQAAVKQVLAAQDLGLIHGPPGTGKTTTLVAAIEDLTSLGQSVLVCAPSNAATDLLTERLAARGLEVVRIGHLSRVDESLYPHTLEGKLENDPGSKMVKRLKRQASEYRDLAGKYKRSFGKEEREQRKRLYAEAKALSRDAVAQEDQLIDVLLDRAQVVTATLVGSAHRYLKNQHFDTLVIDEAAQALEPSCWIPVQKANKVILAGDPCQLPPTVKHNPKPGKGLAVTLLEKALERQEKKQLLQVQYRMNRLIMGFSNNWFYNNQLEADAAVADHELPGEALKPVLEFVDTAGCGFDEETETESQSLHNSGERDILQKHLQQLQDLQPIADQSIGLISPYKAQVLRLQSDFEGATENLTVNTIDAFQGQERDIIYVSMVRSNGSGIIGFLSDYRRMNVAMTRARKKLVLIGDSATLGQDRFYSELLTYCEENGAYFSAWEWMS